MTDVRVELDERATWFYEAISSSDGMVNPVVGAGQVYMTTKRDRNGDLLRADRTYRLRIPGDDNRATPPPPRRPLWSGCLGFELGHGCAPVGPTGASHGPTARGSTHGLHALHPWRVLRRRRRFEPDDRPSRRVRPGKPHRVGSHRASRGRGGAAEGGLRLHRREIALRALRRAARPTTQS